MTINDKPTYNLKAVLRETGIGADTLRAWERRYGLPMPDRSPGGHRIYSQRDIEIVKWLMAKQGEGLSISRAVELWKELSAAGQDPLPPPTPQVELLPSANLEEVRKRWLEACLTFNENAAEQILNQAFAMYPLESVCVDVIQLGLNEIGDMWYHDRASIQQEHFAAALAQRRMNALIAASPPPTRAQTFLLGCTPKEQHTFTPLLLTLLLRRRGYSVIYLGADVPILRFRETIQSIRPHLVILTAQLLETAHGLRNTVIDLVSGGTRVAFGGRIFSLQPEIRKRIPAHFLGESIPEALGNLDSLLTSNTAVKDVIPVSEEDQALGEAFLLNQAMIDMYALAESQKMGIPLPIANEAIQRLGSNLYSALSLGYIEALAAELTWIDGLIGEHNQNISSLNEFLDAYAKSIDSAMREKGQPISDWMRSHAQPREKSK